MLLSVEDYEYEVGTSWEHKCAICGKLFYVLMPSLWSYKTKGNNPDWLCGYSCSRKAEKGSNPTKSMRGEKCMKNQTYQRSNYKSRGRVK